ncbi:Uncharacterised protein [Candidatus Burarchaeum australiense]|nr:Uncharacterised protein [Candidatus Burarchaeum australiense]
MAKVVKAGGHLALVLPDAAGKELGLKEGDELAFYELRPGVYAVARRGEEIAREVSEEAEREEGSLNGDEIAVVRKLESVNFVERTPKKVAELLTSAEKRILDSLVERKFVGFFKSAKYKEGVYNIPKEIYELVRKGGKAGQAGPSAGNAAAGGRAASAAEAGNPEEALEKYGYAIVEREDEAKALSERLNPQIKSGELMGVRGFDKRFYLARKGFYVAVSERIEKSLRGKKARTSLEIARDAKVKEDECAVVLNLMREQGDVLEKKRGTYELA